MFSWIERTNNQSTNEETQQIRVMGIQIEQNLLRTEDDKMSVGGWDRWGGEYKYMKRETLIKSAICLFCLV